MIIPLDSIPDDNPLHDSPDDNKLYSIPDDHPTYENIPYDNPPR